MQDQIPRFGHKLGQDIKSLMVLNKTTRPWHIPFIASLCAGIPVLIGVYFGRPDYGILACLGSMVILYLPQTPIPHRMVTMVVAAFGFSVCFTLSALTSFNPYFSAAVLAASATLATLICRLYVIGPPGSFFFIMIAALASTLPFDLALIPMRVGLIALGGMLSVLLAFFYSLCVGRDMASVSAPNTRPVNALVLESAVIGLFVGGSLLLALLMHMDNPYWVPISCAAIMQGATLRIVWHRKLHRIVGTIIGMGLTWIIFSLPLNAWELGLLIIGLNFIIEFLIVRNYALAVVFITPLTVLFAEFGSRSAPADTLVMVRLFDIILGSVIGFIGGWVMHHPRIFSYAGDSAHAPPPPKE